MIARFLNCSDPTREQLAHKLLVGQRATWPKIHMVPNILQAPLTRQISHRLRIEQQIERGRASARLKAINNAQSPAHNGLMQGTVLSGVFSSEKVFNEQSEMEAVPRSRRLTRSSASSKGNRSKPLLRRDGYPKSRNSLSTTDEGAQHTGESKESSDSDQIVPWLCKRGSGELHGEIELLISNMAFPLKSWLHTSLPKWKILWFPPPLLVLPWMIEHYPIVV